MKLKPGRIILAVLLLVGLGYGIRALVIWRSPPQLTVSIAERVPANELFEFSVGSSKEVDMTLEADGVTLQSSGDAWSVHLPATVGTSEFTLTVQDRAGNVVQQPYSVTGVAAPELTLVATEQVMAGDAVGAWLQVDAGDNLLRDEQILLNGEPLPTVRHEGGLLALHAVPFDAGGAALELAATVTDEFGRRTDIVRSYQVAPIDRPVELLQLSAATLEFQSEENTRLQAERLSDAMAQPLPQPAWTQPFVLPASGFGSSGYGDPRRYFAEGEVSHHLGADLAAPTGTPVLATNDGVVVLAETLPVAGGAVVIDHGGGVSSRYYHLSLITSQVGARVQRGDLIAEVGSTGLSTGPHLHWEMRIAGEPANPLPWTDSLLPGVPGFSAWSATD